MYQTIFKSTCNITSRNYGRSRQPSNRTDVSLDTKDIEDPSVVQTIRQIEKNRPSNVWGDCGREIHQTQIEDI